MSTGEGAETRGGPQWLHGADQQASSEGEYSSPSAVRSKPVAGFGDGNAPASNLYAAEYSRTAVSPLPFMVAAFVAIAASWRAVDWVKVTPEATDPVRSSEWWTNITAVLLPFEGLGGGAYSASRMWITLAILVTTAVVIAVWIGRIGTNVRSGHAPFGSLLPIIAFPAWWILPLSLGFTGGESRSRSDLIMRYLVAFGILFAQYLLLRWPTLNRIWRAGQLPFDLGSIALWLPNLIPLSLLLLSNAFTLFTGDEATGYRTSSWEPTATMSDWAVWTTRISGLAIILLLVMVSVRQQVGMMNDRRDDREMRAR